jgi:two-component system, cell cycle response regulator
MCGRQRVPADRGVGISDMEDVIQENEELKKRLTELTAEAANNESIMKRTQARELTLLRAETLAQLLHAMVDGLRESYALDAVNVVLLDPQHEVRHLLLAGGDRPEEFKQVFFVDSLVGLAPQLTALHKPWLGPFVGADHHLLFPGTSNLKSAALVPLPRKDRATGALCFGSRDVTRFTRHHGTDFLAHLGAVAAVCVENAVNRARLLRAGITDFLTGWANRRYLQQRLKEELARAQRRAGSIACLMIDIDRFKSINDGYGHMAGDNALKEIAHRVESQIRSMDTAARFGGDELTIILPEAGAAEAMTLAERIREVIAAVPFTLTAQIERNLTVSIGVAAVAPGRLETDLKPVADRLLADADAALYRAKALGRNRVQSGAG